MKKRSLFWIDSSSMGALLSDAGVQDTGDRPSFSAPVPARRSPAPVRKPAQDDPPVSIFAGADQSSPEELPPFVTSGEGSLEHHLEALLDWIGELGIDASFIADQEGLALVQRNVAPETIAACASLTHLWDSLRSGLQLPAGNAIQVELDGGKRVCVLPAKSARGVVNLGFEAADEVSRPKLEAILAAFQGLALSI